MKHLHTKQIHGSVGLRLGTDCKGHERIFPILLKVLFLDYGGVQRNRYDKEIYIDTYIHLTKLIKLYT